MTDELITFPKYCSICTLNVRFSPVDMPLKFSEIQRMVLAEVPLGDNH
jgi:hypothetical protein